MDIITPEEISNYLKSKGIQSDTYTTETLSTKISLYKNYLLSLIGLSLDEEEHTITDIDEKIFDDKNYLLPNYPVTEIEYIKVEDKEINPDKYLIDKENGIIRWKDRTIIGEYLEIKYKTQIKDPSLIGLINTIISDMIYYDLNPATDKNLTSIHEGDVSITYNTSNSTGSRINSNINLLKSKYSLIRGRII